MSTTTTRNSLVKPGYADAADIAVINTNYDTIDASFAKCNWAGGAAPAVTDDGTKGYSIGSIWFDTTGHKVYIAETVGTGTATWRELFQTGAAFSTAYQITSTLADGGVSPLAITSKVVCTNLNADMLDGLHDTSFVKQTLADAKGDLLVASANDTWARQAVGANSYPIRAYSGAANGVAYYPERDNLFLNALYNGSFQICQTGITTVTSASTYVVNTDDTYVTDGWTLLSDGNDIVDCYITTDTGAQSGTVLKLEVENANKKFGIIQFVENKWAQHLVGKYVSLQFQAKTVTGKVINNLRAAVLSWSSTADTLTSDVVSAWEASGTNPTLAANWTAENVAANLALVSDTYTKYTIENIYIDTASTTNIAVFIWVDDTDGTVDDLVYITDIQLNEGAICLPYCPRRFDEDLVLCQRFWEASYTYGVYPGSSNIAPGLTHAFAQSTSVLWYAGGNQYRVPKRAAVTPVLYSYAGTVNKVTDTVTTDVGTTVTAGSTDVRLLRTGTDSGAGFTMNALYRSHWVADGRL